MFVTESAMAQSVVTASFYDPKDVHKEDLEGINTFKKFMMSRHFFNIVKGILLL